MYFSRLARWLLLGSISCHLPLAVSAGEEALVRPARILIVEDPQSTFLRNFPAEVTATIRTELAFRVPGLLVELPVREGEAVTEGQLLARLDPTDYEVTLQQREAEYALASQQYQRFRSMISRQLISQAQYDEKKAQLAVASAALSRAKLDLQYTRLAAPYSGTVSRRLLENHQNIQAKEPVLILQSDDQLDVDFQLPENIFAMKPRSGARSAGAQVYFDALPGQVFKAVYRERSAEADPATGTYTVTLTLPQPENLELYPGMTARVEFDLNEIFEMEQAQIFIPVEAVYAAEDTPKDSLHRHIWKVNPQTMTVYRAEVTVGRLSTDGLEILSGLQAGEQVVTAGVHYLQEGMKVRPWVRERGL
ncbi:MAG: efflux RND transporter periplasmic adaptor subunit [Marinobacterium sp.]|nr:efflux RND transporter periplasmic adaptor subunit [Marinobacterium sp.]